MTCPFCNITTLKIVDIVDQLLKVTESVWVMYSSLCGSPVAVKLQGGYYPEERMTETVDSLSKEWCPIIKHLYL